MKQKRNIDSGSKEESYAILALSRRKVEWERVEMEAKWRQNTGTNFGIGLERSGKPHGGMVWKSKKVLKKYGRQMCCFFFLAPV